MTLSVTGFLPSLLLFCEVLDLKMEWSLEACFLGFCMNTTKSCLGAQHGVLTDDERARLSCIIFRRWEGLEPT